MVITTVALLIGMFSLYMLYYIYLCAEVIKSCKLNSSWSSGMG
ncbi:hypothetical protein Mpsy_2780 [Methanolobus psychrophilus R15]|nr:hypothetical protein Mpsy_2780 [Methanolobus psychrophilus R15]